VQNFADLTWGKTHGSQPTGGVAADTDKEKENDLEMGIVFANNDVSQNSPRGEADFIDDDAPALVVVDSAELDEVDFDDDEESLIEDHPFWSFLSV